MNNGFGIFDVHVTKVVIPIFIRDFRSLREFASGESGVDFRGGSGKLVQYPEFSKRFATCSYGLFLRSEVFVQFAQDEFSRLVDFVAEPTIAVHLLNVEIDVAT